MIKTTVFQQPYRTPELWIIPVQLFTMYDEKRFNSSRDDLSEEDPSRRVSKNMYAVSGDAS
jgi:hypothetical protein